MILNHLVLGLVVILCLGSAFAAVERDAKPMDACVMAFMAHSFHDEDLRFEYDEQVRMLKKNLPKLSACEAATHLQGTMNALNNILDTYWPRPCMAGFCWHILTPHRDRIRARLSLIRNTWSLCKIRCSSLA